MARPSLFDHPILKPMNGSELFQRRTNSEKRRCERCAGIFVPDEVYVQVDHKRWHQECFMCAQCFCPLATEEYFKDGDRYYCEHDFRVNLAPVCQRCHGDVIGGVVRAATGNYHSACFRCQECEGSLDDGVWIVDARMVCFACKENFPSEPHYTCIKCRQKIERHDLLRVSGDFYHAYHFDCTDCRKMLESTARSIKSDLYCSRCFDLRSEICADCKRPIDKDVERSVSACKKHWHLDHFRCAHCGRPFRGNAHFEKNGKAYCEQDFIELFGDYCFVCSAPLTGEFVSLFSKFWCRHCYSCFACNKPLKLKDKVLEWDMRPMCKSCFSSKKFKKILEEKEKARRKEKS